MGSPASMPLGFRFRPNDEELVGHYLEHKLLGNNSTVHNVIAEIDVCKFEPWDLPAFSKVKSDDQEWFFFSPVGLKFTKDTRNRCNRKTKAGFWKPTGKDRNIKTRGTNNVIGTKKTLVFYTGRSSHAVKTNWVIHEYHAVTFPEDKRGFVLCRLINKAEKKAERGTDSLIHNEGEPSSHTAADFENQESEGRIPNVYTLPEVNLESIFPTPPQAEEYDFPSLQQSSIVTEQEPSFQGSPFPNADFQEENSIMHVPLETIAEEDNLDNIYIDKFLNEILADEDAFIGKETIPAFVIEAIPTLKKAYGESRETDGEPLSAQAQKETHILESIEELIKAQGTSARKNLETPLPVELSKHDNIPDTTTFNEHTGSKENLVVSTVQSLHDTVNAGPPSLSSKNEVNQEKKGSSSDDEFWEQFADDDLIANEPLSICMLTRVRPSLSPPRTRSPSPPRRCQNKYYLTSRKFMSPRAAPGKSQTKRNILSQAVSQQKALKETHTKELNKEQRKAQGTISRKKLERKSNLSSGVIGKGSFIHLETPLVQRSWFFFTWSCAWSWRGFEFHHDMVQKVKLKGVSQ